MSDWLAESWRELLARPSGPMALRFYCQPLMAIGFAVRDGLKDARQNKPAYFWALFTDRSRRTELPRDGWRSIGKIFTIAFVLDFVYQLFVLRRVRVLEALFVAATLAIVPYVALRGPVNRIARRRRPAHDQDLAA
jgi:hypothetical protein